MLGLYAVWAALPAIVSRVGRRRATWRVGSLLTVLILGLVATLQDSETNKDREVYGFLIDAIKNEDTFAMEPGFYLLVKLLGVAFSGAELNAAFFFVVAAVSIAIKLRLFRAYGDSMFGCLAAFFSYFFLVHEITQVRTGLAIGLLYLSWFSFAEHRSRDFWLYGLAASLFHVSCALFVVAPILFAPDKWRRWLLGLFVAASAAAISAFAGNEMLNALDQVAEAVGIERLGMYLVLLEQGVLSEISPVRLVPHTLLLAAAALGWRRWRRDRLTLFVVQIYSYGPIIFILLSPIPALAYRVSDLFLFAGIFVTGRMRACVARSLYYPLVVAYTAAFLVYTIQFSGLFIADSGR